MLVRCNGTSEQNEAIKSLMRIRMRMAGLMDHTYHWQSSHPGNPKLDFGKVPEWFNLEWKKAKHLSRDAIVAPGPDSREFDENLCQFQLYYYPEWPLDKIVGKRVGADGCWSTDGRWTQRLIDSIKEHGIIDPVLAWCHKPDMKVYGRPPGTPNVVLGSNRIAVANYLKLGSVPAVISFDKQPKNAAQRPPEGGEPWSFEQLHDRFEFDLWVTPTSWYPVHPPTKFYDEKDGRCHDLDSHGYADGSRKR